MRIFLTGANGYIGGSVAQKLLDSGHDIHGLVRSADKAKLVETRGIKAVIGTLDDSQVIKEAAAAADAVINTASSDHRGAVEAIVEALTGTGKPFIHTSGSSIVADDARGEYEGETISHDDSVFKPIPIREARIAIDRFVRTSGIMGGIRSSVICPTMIYGEGLGVEPNSDQIPKLTKASKERGVGLYIGKGLNRWSNVNINDIVELYKLVLDKAPTGSFFFAESGEASLKEVAQSVSKALGFGGKTETWNADEAIAQHGDWARFALASNSRVRGTNARALLGWAPKHPSLAETVEGAATVSSAR